MVSPTQGIFTASLIRPTPMATPTQVTTTAGLLAVAPLAMTAQIIPTATTRPIALAPSNLERVSLQFPALVPPTLAALALATNTPSPRLPSTLEPLGLPSLA